MIPSPLSLKTHFFSRIEVEAQPCLEGEPGDGLVSSHLECARHEEEERCWMVQLGIKLEKEEELPAPHYTYHLEIIGVFSLAEEVELKDPDTFVKVNGAAVLYGAAREMIANLTARGPFDAVELPTVTFVDEVDAKDSVGDE